MIDRVIYLASGLRIAHMKPCKVEREMRIITHSIVFFFLQRLGAILVGAVFNFYSLNLILLPNCCSRFMVTGCESKLTSLIYYKCCKKE